ncbi:MAG: glyoxylate/hydroxypyruvate reductase A [Burkholderiaceae bacterium]|nr:glyoxylate/hydroxypyruvate reductase A [Burkholderiaceae bacterium]
MRILFYAPAINPEAWIAALKQALPQAEVRNWEEGDVAPADYALVWKPPREMLAGRSDLKAIFNLGAGVDAILQLADGLPAHVPVIRLDDAGMGVQMAEYVTHAVLRYFRRFDQFDLQARSGEWRFLKPREKNEFPVGILGLGLLGQRVAHALAPFEFPLCGWSRTPKNLPGVECFHGAEGLDAFLAASQVVACLLPLTAETDRILNRERLAKMPQGSYLINVARGRHVVEADLLEMVQSGHIAGATLDVFEQEPLPAGHPFWKEPRITVTPHIAALTVRDESVRQIAHKIAMLERGEAVTGLVDRGRGY